VIVPMVDVRKVDVRMPHRFMFVKMRVRHDTIPIGTMLVKVMLVVRMEMGMTPINVRMLVQVPFRDVKQDTQCHQQGRHHQPQSQRFVLQS